MMSEPVNIADRCRQLVDSGQFDPGWYLQRYPDVAASGMDPLLHFVRYGQKEGRKPCAKPSVQALPPARSDSIQLVFAVNEKYIPYLSVALVSIMRNLPGNQHVTASILHLGLDPDKFCALDQMGFANLEITPIDASPYLDNIVAKLHVDDNLSAETYLRLTIPLIFAKYRRVLYLDSDIAVNSPITSLYNENFDGNLICAAPDITESPYFWKMIREKHPHHIKNYCNAGVMLMNVPALNQFRFTEITLAHAGRAIKYLCCDQDIINIECDGRIRILPISWNYHPIIYTECYSRFMTLPVYKEYARYFDNPCLVHFVSEKKPWHYYDDHFAPMWWKYARHSPYFERLERECPYPLDAFAGNEEESDE